MAGSPKKQDGEAQYQTRTKEDDDWLWLRVVQGSKAINVSWDFG